MDLPRAPRRRGRHAAHLARPRPARNADRRALQQRQGPQETRGRTDRSMDAAFARFTKDEMAARLDAEELAWAPAQTLAEVAADPQVVASGAVVQTPSSKSPGESFATPGGPARFVGADDGPKGPAPTLGQHTRNVLEALGYSGDEIDALYASRAVS
ncbi:MAG: CoA transferase [Hyphomonadaceae bacterium]